MSKFYDQLLINGNEVIVNKSQVLSLFKKWLTLFVALLCGIFSTVLITTTDTPFRFLSIPVSLLFVVYYALVYAKIGTKENLLVLKVDKNVLEYCGFGACVIKTENIVSVEDKSYYYDFNGNGPANKGWDHKILITYTNVDNSQKTLTIEHCLKHHNHEMLLTYVNKFIHNK